MVIYSSKQAYLEHVNAISHSLQKYIFNDVLQVLIKDHLTLTIRGFVIISQISNLALDLSFYHNSWILGLNEQCKGALGIYTSRPFQWCLEAQFGAYLPFQPRL
jgi:hypothetical protein